VRIALTLLAGAAIAVAFALPAGAATYTLTCPTADDSCKALAERLEAQVAATEANGVKLDAANTKLDAITAAVGSDPGTTEVAGVVALSDDDASRLDLAWWGVWLVAGFLLVLIAAPMWERAWRFWRE
jgi:hypothetical protein